jgi:two-component system LytT family response regulator
MGHLWGGTKHMTFIDSSPSHLPVKVKRSISYVDCNSIKWFKTDGNYTTLHLNDNRSIVSRVSLKDLEGQLPPGQFVRIHKSVIVNCEYIVKRTATKMTIGDTTLTIGRVHQKQVYAFFDRLTKNPK